MKTRYRKSHLIEATYFIQDEKYKVSGSWTTNSHGKQIVSMAIKDKYDTKIALSSYNEVKAVKDLLSKMLRATKGKWLKKSQKKKTL